MRLENLLKLVALGLIGGAQVVCGVGDGVEKHFFVDVALYVELESLLAFALEKLLFQERTHPDDNFDLGCLLGWQKRLSLLERCC